MKKNINTLVIAIISFLLSTGNVNAQVSLFGNDELEENPGGWDFSGPGLSVKTNLEHGRAKFSADLSSSFSFGFISGVNQDEGVSIDMGQSYEIHWDNVFSAKAKVGRRGLFDIGIGLDWRNYRMTNGNMFDEDEAGHISITNDTPLKFSRIHTFSISVPIKYYHQLGKHVYFGVGPELYFTPHASLKNRFDKKNKTLDTHIHHNRFSFDVGAELMIRGIGVYYKYNPFSVLDTNYGPKFSSMTVGIKVGL